MEKAQEEEWRHGYMTLEMRYKGKYEEGCHDADVETAKKMLADGWDHKLIAKYSDLPLEEIEKLPQPDPV